VSETNPDFVGEADQPASGRSSEAGFFDIFTREFGQLKRIVAGMGISSSDAEDVLQDVSVQALKRAGEYRTASEAVHWLIKVTVNRCLTEHRRRKRFRRQVSEILKRRSKAKAYPTRPDEKIIQTEELEIVRETLQELDNTLLMPLVLRYFCDMNSKEVGEILELKSSTVRSRLQEGRMILAKRLIERGIEP
jgi:RNA polymerase sigma-70 factor (ECF subfamily)